MALQAGRLSLPAWARWVTAATCKQGARGVGLVSSAARQCAACTHFCDNDDPNWQHQVPPPALSTFVGSSEAGPALPPNRKPRVRPLEHARGCAAHVTPVGPETQIWLRTSALGVDPVDRRRLDFAAALQTPLGEALCCDVTLVSEVRAREGPTRLLSPLMGRTIRRAKMCT